jgi:uncharacterized protein DUF5655
MSHFGFQQRETFPPVAKLSNMPGSSERLISHSRLFFPQTAELWMACTESAGRSWMNRRQSGLSALPKILNQIISELIRIISPAKPNQALQLIPRLRHGIAELYYTSPTMSAIWSCPKCKRGFTRKHQRHACGTGNRLEVLRGRPDSLVALYSSLESFAKTLGPVEFVARDRYVLLRSSRIFADLVVMTDALRVAVHLSRRVADPIFFKIGADRKRVSHVAKLRDETSLLTLKPYLREAYEFSIL